MGIFERGRPKDFKSPTQLPEDGASGIEWQEANRSWWEEHSMRYDFDQAIPYEEFSTDFYKEIDRRFFSLTREYMPWRMLPFDPLIDFEKLRKARVLEIGVGNGSHAALLAANVGEYTGIDITQYAINSTSKRFELMGLSGNIRLMDAEKMDFDDHSFDYIWSWGVIHHSSNTAAILSEMNRVLKPGGVATTMVYFRNWWNYWIIAGFHEGVVLGKLFRGKTVHEILQEKTDGAIARYYTIPEWKKLVSPWFVVKDTRIFGNKAELLPWGLPVPEWLIQGVKNAIPNPVSRFFTNTCKMGTFLVTNLEKR